MTQALRFLRRRCFHPRETYKIQIYPTRKKKHISPTFWHFFESMILRLLTTFWWDMALVPWRVYNMYIIYIHYTHQSSSKLFGHVMKGEVYSVYGIRTLRIAKHQSELPLDHRLSPRTKKKERGKAMSHFWGDKKLKSYATYQVSRCRESSKDTNDSVYHWSIVWQLKKRPSHICNYNIHFNEGGSISNIK